MVIGISRSCLREIPDRAERRRKILAGSGVWDDDTPVGERKMGKRPVVEASAVPDPESISKLLAGLRESLPRFCEEGEKLGKSFARGEWRATLERLMTYLEELRVVLSGFQAVQRLTQSGAFSGVSSVREILSNLSSPIQRQSWVEVSDLLLYELVPLIDEWQRDSSWDEE